PKKPTVLCKAKSAVGPKSCKRSASSPTKNPESMLPRNRVHLVREDDQGWAREAATLSWAYGFQSQAIRGQFLGMAPAALAILPQRTDSDAMNLLKACADAWVKGSMPIFCKLAVTSGELTVSTSAACSLSMMGLGVLAG